MSVPDISVEVVRKVTAIGQEMKSRAVRGSKALENAEKQVLRGRRSGKIYKKPHKKTRYTASAPGEPPAARTGVLRKSFRSVANSSGGDLSVRVAIETDKDYAGYLEYGTSKMAARPYVEKIKQRAVPEIKSIFGAPYNV